MDPKWEFDALIFDCITTIRASKPGTVFDEEVMAGALRSANALPLSWRVSDGLWALVGMGLLAENEDGTFTVIVFTPRTLATAIEATHTILTSVEDIRYEYSVPQETARAALMILVGRGTATAGAGGEYSIS